MSVTFLIGNGFDLNLGMKTRYTDMYEGYVKSKSKSRVIEKFKRDLQKDEHNHYENWSDFEMGMAKYATTFLSEDDFVECIRDFKGYMVGHLRKEEARLLEMINDNDCANGLLKTLDYSLNSFYLGLTQNDINKLAGLVRKSEGGIKYITFNYTSTLDAFLELKAKHLKLIKNPPIHIHGKLDKEVVMGIDSTKQFDELQFSLSRKGIRAFVKTLFNEQYDKERIEHAKGIISRSSVICVYGFSMGESDKTWNDLLANWLVDNPEHHLVVYQYDETEYNYYNYDEIMDIEDERKFGLLKKLGITNESVLNQIHIPVGNNIFDFEFRKIVLPKPMGSLVNSY